MRAPGSGLHWGRARAWAGRATRPRSHPERQLSRRYLLLGHDLYIAMEQPASHSRRDGAHCAANSFRSEQWHRRLKRISAVASPSGHEYPPCDTLGSKDGQQMFPIPKSVFLTRGVGVHRQRLSAFEYALRDADIEQQNLVTVSSILPANCELITRKAGVAMLSP